jgi:hypothetical protein
MKNIPCPAPRAQGQIKKLRIDRKVAGATFAELIRMSETHEARQRRGYRTQRGCERAITRGVALRALVEHLEPLMRDSSITVKETLRDLKGMVLYSTEDRERNAAFAALLTGGLNSA